MNKKKAAGCFLLAIVLAACVFVIIHAYEPPLKRAGDKEFLSGSQIRIKQASDIQLKSLYKLCKVWGFAKYHHPSVVDGTLNWDAELFRVLPELLQAKTGEEANEVLYHWLSRFPFEPEETEEARIWQELQVDIGAGSLDTGWIQNADFLGEDLCSYMEKLSRTFIADRSNAYASFTMDAPFVSFNNEIMLPFKPEDAGVKLLSLFRFWNIYEYYSPNRQITKKDWDEVLKESIPEMLAAQNYRDYVLAVARVTAATADAHITISDKEHTLARYYGKYFLPCSIKVIAGQLVVDQTAENGQELRAGDIIEAIDGISVRQRITELSRYTALPEPDKFVLKMGTALLGTEKEKAEVQVIRNDEKLVLQVKSSESPYTFRNPYSNGFIEQGQIGYIDPSALKKGDLEKLMKEFAAAKGIIVDLRYYPSVFIPYLLGEYITPEPKQFVRMTYPNQATPGSFFYMDNFYSGAGALDILNGEAGSAEYPPYRGRVILLMDETSMSQSEFTIMALRQSPNAVVVGSPSIGADGNVARLSLPGNITMNITGLGVYTPEGKQTQRVGLKPDVECLPTVEGLREGRDELIEKAAELILE